MSPRGFSIPGNWESVVRHPLKSLKCHRTNCPRIHPGFSFTLSSIIALACSLVPACMSIKNHPCLSTESVRYTSSTASSQTSFPLQSLSVSDKAWTNFWPLAIPVCTGHAEVSFLTEDGVRLHINSHGCLGLLRSSPSSFTLHNPGHR